MRRIQRFPAFSSALLAVGLVAGCGGGRASTTTSTVPPTTAVDSTSLPAEAPTTTIVGTRATGGGSGLPAGGGP